MDRRGLRGWQLDTKVLDLSQVWRGFQSDPDLCCHDGIVRVLLAIPALNEESTLADVISASRCEVAAEVLVVNDASTDSTAAVAREAGAMVVTMPYNVGVGGAMRTAFCFAAGHDYDVVVQVDADGQHEASQIPKLLAAVEAGSSVVVGSRFAEGYNTTRLRLFAMRSLAWVTSRLTGVSLSDTTSGFRASDRRAIELFARRYPVEYLGDTVESLVVAAHAGLSISEVSVRMRPRQGGVASQATTPSVLYLGRVLLALAVAAVGRKDADRA